MSFIADNIPYRDTGAFSKIAVDYPNHLLRPFYAFEPDMAGIKKAVEARKEFPVDRELLIAVLEKQYRGKNKSDALQANIRALRSENCFTVCTAHQPNIFTGHLYFVYKILHAVRLSETLNKEMPACHFVPVYYMGSEDADLDELGEINIHGNNYRWQTAQRGAVGRMKIDADFLQVIAAIRGILAVNDSGRVLMKMIEACYREGSTIEEATFDFVHHLFNEFGLVVLLPDCRELKEAFIPVLEKELTTGFSHREVAITAAAFPAEYGMQASGRDINLFYLDNGLRERIQRQGEGFVVVNTNLAFTRAELQALLRSSPEKFSPNVILRPLFQELILPDVAFIGGGGELAYWLELKTVFRAAKIFFPVILLRNSFTIITKQVSLIMQKLSLDTTDIFKAEKELATALVKSRSSLQLDLTSQKTALTETYSGVELAAAGIDPSLRIHAKALLAKALAKLDAMEKKMMRAEARKFSAETRQLAKMKSSLFPRGTLQERHDNILPYIAQHGLSFLQTLYEFSQPLPQSFTVITEK